MWRERDSKVIGSRSRCVAALRETGLAVAVLILGAQTASAEEHIVRTRRAEWVPPVLFIQPGDTVVWRGMRTHETALIEGMGPTDATAWRSELDAEGYSVTLHDEGVYIYTCDVHMSLGMVGAIVVGDAQPRNLAAIDAAVENIDVGRIFVERIIGRMKRALARRN
jgi:plastocyanin